MRNPATVLSALILIGGIGPASAQEAPIQPMQARDSSSPHFLDMPAYDDPAISWKTLDDGFPGEEICRDRIRKAREEAGLPVIERKPATADDPMLIWAVDRREDGCSVLVVKGDPDDIRPIPPTGGTVERIPAQ